MFVATKKNKDEIRNCINPKDLNTAIKRPHYPMLTVEEIAAQMGEATVFTVLDAKSSFWQIALEHNSKSTTFSTPFGRYKCILMPFGISSASEVFQHTMEQLFAGYPGSIVVDDILVAGQTIQEHDANLKWILDHAK